MKTAVIYTRVSTDSQDFSRQIEDLTRYSNEHGYNLLKTFDEKISGTKDSDEREQLSALMKFVENNHTDIVLCWEVSRLGRNTENVLRTVRFFNERKINVFLKKENIFTLNDDGTENSNAKLVFTILAEIGSIERKTTLERSRSGLERNSKMLGHWTGGVLLPYGYRRDEKKLVVDDVESEVVKRIFQYHSEGMGTTLIAERLNDEKIPTRYNKVFQNKEVIRTKTFTKKPSDFRWVDGTIYSILTNPIYKGMRRYKETYIPAPSIIPSELFDSIQEKLRGNFSRLGTNIKHFYLLENTELKCGICGRSYHALKRQDGKDNRYVCLSKRYKSDCGNTGIGIDKLANSVWYISLKTGYIKDHIKRTLKNSDINKDISEKESTLDRYASELNNILKKEKFLIDLYMNGDLSEDALKERNVSVKVDRIKLSRLIDTLKTEISELKKYRDMQHDMNIQIRTIKGNKHMMKKYLEEIVDRITISPVQFTIGTIKDDKNIVCELYLKQTPTPIRYIISQRSDNILVLNPLEYKNGKIIGNQSRLLERIQEMPHHTENSTD